MSKEISNIQRRIIQINHAFSGVFGEDLRQQANKIIECRKEIIRKLERKKKHSNILHDELYQYLQKFPQQISSLQQQVLTTKKNPIFEFQEKQKYEMPSIELKHEEAKFVKQEVDRLQSLGNLLGKSTLNMDKILQQ